MKWIFTGNFFGGFEKTGVMSWRNDCTVALIRLRFAVLAK